MSLPKVNRPIIFVGAPRSGTTVVFNSFAARRDLAWFTQHLSRLPNWPIVTVLARLTDLSPGLRKSVDRSDLARGRLEKLRVGPSEAYGIWRRCCGDRFLYDFLLDQEASEIERERTRELVAKLLRYQGKDRFATKITGPARIAYLSSIFPDALFVHVVRDGRAVVRSLMKVHFWAGTWRERGLAWEGGLSEAELARWRDLGEAPIAMAALQWRAIIRTARAEAARLAGDRYTELRYEDFVAAPAEALREVSSFCGLPPSSEPSEFIESRLQLRDMNYHWRQDFSAGDLELLDALIGDDLAELGYERTGGRSPELPR